MPETKVVWADSSGDTSDVLIVSFKLFPCIKDMATDTTGQVVIKRSMFEFAIDRHALLTSPSDLAFAKYASGDLKRIAVSDFLIRQCQRYGITRIMDRTSGL